ncbi:MAG: hypothetical protein ACJ77X_12015, partial [Chloroflexota bacterium]
ASRNEPSFLTISLLGSGSSPSMTSVGSGDAPGRTLVAAEGYARDGVGELGELDGVVATP